MLLKKFLFIFSFLVVLFKLSNTNFIAKVVLEVSKPKRILKNIGGKEILNLQIAGCTTVKRFAFFGGSLLTVFTVCQLLADDLLNQEDLYKLCVSFWVFIFPSAEVGTPWATCRKLPIWVFMAKWTILVKYAYNHSFTTLNITFSMKIILGKVFVGLMRLKLHHKQVLI